MIFSNYTKAFLLFSLCFSTHYIHSAAAEVELKQQIELTPEQKEVHEQFLKAVQYGGYQQFTDLLPQIIDVNYKDAEGDSALFLASANTYGKMVIQLLERHADPNSRNDVKKSPLAIASRKGSYEIVSLLLNAGADPDIKDYLGDTALMLASMNSQKYICELLLKAGANPLLTNDQNKTALQSVRDQETAELIKKYIKYYEEFQEFIKKEITAAKIALKLNDMEIKGMPRVLCDLIGQYAVVSSYREWLPLKILEEQRLEEEKKLKEKMHKEQMLFEHYPDDAECIVS